jgi:hypothetical protein
MNGMMKKLTAILVVMAAIGQAQAILITYQDIDAPNHRIGGLTRIANTPGYTGTNSYTGVFDIVNGDGDTDVEIINYPTDNGIFSDIAGYAADGSLVSATASFYLKNADRANDGWDFNLDIYDFLNGEDASHHKLTVENSITGAAFTLLNDNGFISYTVTATQGGSDFILQYAKLTALTEVGPRGVPEGGATLVLLGMALTGIGLLKAKFGLN